MRPYVEIWERVNFKRETWERSFDLGKTWELVDWSMCPCFPFLSSEPKDYPWIGARMITETERDKLYPGKGVLSEHTG